MVGAPSGQITSGQKHPSSTPVRSSHTIEPSPMLQQQHGSGVAGVGVGVCTGVLVGRGSPDRIVGAPSGHSTARQMQSSGLARKSHTVAGIEGSQQQQSKPWHLSWFSQSSWRFTGPSVASGGPTVLAQMVGASSGQRTSKHRQSSNFLQMTAGSEMSQQQHGESCFALAGAARTVLPPKKTAAKAKNRIVICETRGSEWVADEVKIPGTMVKCLKKRKGRSCEFLSWFGDGVQDPITSRSETRRLYKFDVHSHFVRLVGKAGNTRRAIQQISNSKAPGPIPPSLCPTTG